MKPSPTPPLLDGLRHQRGKGRNDYPVHVLWGVLLLTIVLRQPTIEACLQELQRHDALCRLIGMEDDGGIPKPWNMSRFLDVLGHEPHWTNLRAVFDAMVQRLGVVVPAWGCPTAGDSSGLNARRTRQQTQANQAAAATPTAAVGNGTIDYDRHGLP